MQRETESSIFVAVDNYINDLFAPDDDVARAALTAAKDASLPEIQVSSGLGMFLFLLAKMIGAKHILELGTLGGYSTIWLARALPPDGSLITLEVDKLHARVATQNIAAAGFASLVKVVVGSALDTLPRVIAQVHAPFDLVFLDADKLSYPTYLREIMKAVHSGSLILADNVIRGGSVLAPPGTGSAADAVHLVNTMLAHDERLESIVLQQVGVKGHDGIAIARVR